MVIKPVLPKLDTYVVEYNGGRGRGLVRHDTRFDFGQHHQIGALVGGVTVADVVDSQAAFQHALNTRADGIYGEFDTRSGDGRARETLVGPVQTTYQFVDFPRYHQVAERAVQIVQLGAGVRHAVQHAAVYNVAHAFGESVLANESFGGLLKKAAVFVSAQTVTKRRTDTYVGLIERHQMQVDVFLNFAEIRVQLIPNERLAVWATGIVINRDVHLKNRRTTN